MADPPPDTAHRVQHAALGAIDALRNLLDAAEEVVGDPQRLQDVVAGVSDLADKVSSSFGGGERTDGTAEDDQGDRQGEGGERDEPASERLRHVPLD